MVWLWIDGKVNENVEVSDFRALVWPSSDSHRDCVVGARLDDLDGVLVTLVIPLPSNASAKVVDAGRWAHTVLERCKLAFPSVVRETVLMRMNDVDDQEDELDQDEPMPGELPALAVKYVEDEMERQIQSKMVEMETVDICTFAEVCKETGADPDKAPFAQNPYLQEDGLFLLAKAMPKSLKEYFAFYFRYESHERFKDQLCVPISTTTSPSEAEASEFSVLDPVTRKMNHQVFSINAERLPGDINNAGKNAEEMIKDMKLRHASGSCTVIVRPKYSIIDIMSILSEKQPQLAPFDNQHFRLRKFVGPYNTKLDLNLFCMQNE